MVGVREGSSLLVYKVLVPEFSELGLFSCSGVVMVLGSELLGVILLLL